MKETCYNPNLFFRKRRFFPRSAFLVTVKILFLKAKKQDFGAWRHAPRRGC